MPDDTLLSLTADIVTAHVANNHVAASDVPALIATVYGALGAAISPPAEPEAAPKPAVPIRSSIKQDYIVCLEDGAKLKMLKRYLQTKFDLTPQQYRQKWGLPNDYPMAAPSYSEKRRTLANAIGLGRKAIEQVETVVEEAAAPAIEAVKAGRRKLKIAVGKAAESTPPASDVAAKPTRTRKPKASPAS